MMVGIGRAGAGLVLGRLLKGNTVLLMNDDKKIAPSIVSTVSQVQAESEYSNQTPFQQKRSKVRLST
jgi:hypothetical protein